MELLFIDIARENRESFGFNDEDIDILNKRKFARLKRLKEEPNGYTEGTYKIFHRIYEEAAGPPANRNINDGLRAIRSFLEAINPDFVLKTTRSTNPEYNRLLERGTADDWRRFVQQEATVSLS